MRPRPLSNNLIWRDFMRPFDLNFAIERLLYRVFSFVSFEMIVVNTWEVTHLTYVWPLSSVLPHMSLEIIVLYNILLHFQLTNGGFITRWSGSASRDESSLLAPFLAGGHNWFQLGLRKFLHCQVCTGSGYSTIGYWLITEGSRQSTSEWFDLFKAITYYNRRNFHSVIVRF